MTPIPYGPKPQIIRGHDGSVTALSDFHELPRQFKALSWFYSDDSDASFKGRYLLSDFAWKRAKVGILNPLTAP